VVRSVEDSGIMARRADGQSRTANGTEMVLRLSRIRKRYGTVTALDDVSIDVRKGEFLTLLGPSGSGKTTTLKIVAGFIKPDAGDVTLQGRDVTGVPAHKRGIGLVFQHYALFPHMTAAANIAFPLRVRRMARNEIADRVRRALDLVRLSGLGDRYARQLSGGQQQRIALARAIVFEPALLLMDEPLGALDRKLRDAMQLEISRISRELGITVIYVTHDQEEALALSDRIAIYNAGRIEQLGTGEELYETPATLFAASFMGESTVFRGHLDEVQGQPMLLSRGRHIPVSKNVCERANLQRGQAAAMIVRPERLRSDGTGASSGRPSVSGVVLEELYLGSIRKYVVDLEGDQRAIARVPLGSEQAWPSVGGRVHLTWNLEHGVLVPDDAA
jgi:putative spermidine/putrescine transport system ATP-binding protein